MENKARASLDVTLIFAQFVAHDARRGQDFETGNQ